MFIRQLFLIGCFLVAGFYSVGIAQETTPKPANANTPTEPSQSYSTSDIQNTAQRLEAQVAALSDFLNGLRASLASNPPRPSEPPIPRTLKILLRVELTDEK